MLLFTEPLGQMRVLTDTASLGVVGADPGLLLLWPFTVPLYKTLLTMVKTASGFIPAQISLQL